jgi:hypothetical protein
MTREQQAKMAILLIYMRGQEKFSVLDQDTIVLYINRFLAREDLSYTADELLDGWIHEAITGEHAWK